MQSLDNSNQPLIELKKGKQNEINIAIEIHTPLGSGNNLAAAGQYLDELWNDATTTSPARNKMETSRHEDPIHGSPDKAKRRMVSAAKKSWI
jgi:hypothetical protein